MRPFALYGYWLSQSFAGSREHTLRRHLQKMLRHRASCCGLDQRGQAYTSPLQLQLDRVRRRREVRIIERVPVGDRRAVRVGVGV